MRVTLMLMLSLAACAPNPGVPSSGIDHCVFERIFLQCLQALPKGPEHVAAAGNDWDEVVDSCKEAARAGAWRALSNIPQNCR